MFGLLDDVAFSFSNGDEMADKDNLNNPDNSESKHEETLTGKFWKNCR